MKRTKKQKAAWAAYHRSYYRKTMKRRLELRKQYYLNNRPEKLEYMRNYWASRHVAKAA